MENPKNNVPAAKTQNQKQNIRHLPYRLTTGQGESGGRSSVQNGVTGKIKQREERGGSGHSNDWHLWKCGQCFKTFTQRILLQMHVCSQNPDRPYQVGTCNVLVYSG